MLVVLSKARERIRSGPLLKKVEDLHSKILNPDYGHNSSPQTRIYGPPIGVRAELNENARERLMAEDNRAILNTFRGMMARSKTNSEMKEVD
jgi:hypothetical protein